MKNRLSEEQQRALLSFAVTVVMAWLMRWEAGDLMWGIWASSVTYGLTYGVLLILKNPEEVDAGDGTEKGRLLGVLAFFIGFFGIFHYAQGIFLSVVFPITPLEGWGLFLYPGTALTSYWGVIVITFYSRWPELLEATKPSDDLQRILEPAKNVAKMQVLIFVFLFLAAGGLIRFAVYPVLVFYFFPFGPFRDEPKNWLEKLGDRMNRFSREEYEGLEELKEERIGSSRTLRALGRALGLLEGCGGGGRAGSGTVGEAESWVWRLRTWGFRTGLRRDRNWGGQALGV